MAAEAETEKVVKRHVGQLTKEDHMSILTRLRGVIGTGLTWAASWGILGTALYGLASALGLDVFTMTQLLAEVTKWGSVGFLGGTVFSAGLILTERRVHLPDLRVWRASLWGMLAGFSGPLLMWVFGGNSSWIDIGAAHLVTAFLGAGSGAGMAAIARAAARESLPRTDETADPIDSDDDRLALSPAEVGDA